VNINLNSVVKLNNESISRESGCIYLGLPLGDSDYKSQFIEDRMRKVERCFCSLYGLGCKSHVLNPMVISLQAILSISHQVWSGADRNK